MAAATYSISTICRPLRAKTDRVRYLIDKGLFDKSRVAKSKSRGVARQFTRAQVIEIWLGQQMLDAGLSVVQVVQMLRSCRKTLTGDVRSFHYLFNDHVSITVDCAQLHERLNKAKVL